jgi:hypothetical protein
MIALSLGVWLDLVHLVQPKKPRKRRRKKR